MYNFKVKFMDFFRKIRHILGNFLFKVFIDKDVIIVDYINLYKDKQHFSQYKQDIYVYENIFKKKRDGVFVDVGANDPFKLSNTYLFELNGWNGIAIEPQKQIQKLWQNNRKTPCFDFVLGEIEKDIVFFESNTKHELSGVKDFNKLNNVLDKNQVIKKQIRLDSLLEENNILKVDYLSIDVEGYELEVLKGIDFDKINIDIIDIENDFNFTLLKIPLIGKYLSSKFGRDEIRKFLKSKNYKQILRIGGDDIYKKIN